MQQGVFRVRAHTPSSALQEHDAHDLHTTFSVSVLALHVEATRMTSMRTGVSPAGMSLLTFQNLHSHHHHVEGELLRSLVRVDGHLHGHQWAYNYSCNRKKPQLGMHHYLQ